MRYSIIGLIGTGLVSVAVGCGDGEDGSATNANGGSAGKAVAGSSGKASTGGSASAGKGGSSSKGGNGGSSAGKGGSGTTGGAGATGGAAATGGTNATGGSNSSAGTGGSVGGAGGAGGVGGTLVLDGGSGGQAGESDASAGGAAGAAGAHEAGNGGEPSSAGAGGAADCGGGVECGNACVDPMTRTLDQSQLDMSGSVGLSLTQRPGESFTVGSAGLLTGIEVAVGPCNGADTSGNIRLELFDSEEASLGAVTIPQSSLPDVCGGDQLVEPTVGAGYFDLTPLCVSAGVGDVFTFILSLSGNTPASCVSNQCSNNGHYCYTDAECTGFYYVGETNCGGTGCDTSPSAYPGGSEVMQDVGSGALQSSPGFELAFKTFMQ